MPLNTCTASSRNGDVDDDNCDDHAADCGSAALLRLYFSPVFVFVFLLTRVWAKAVWIGGPVRPGPELVLLMNVGLSPEKTALI